MADKKKTVRSCADCTYYSYDEEYGGYVCDVNMDEDEYVRLISDSRYACVGDHIHCPVGSLMDRGDFLADVAVAGIGHRLQGGRHPAQAVSLEGKPCVSPGIAVELIDFVVAQIRSGKVVRYGHELFGSLVEPVESVIVGGQPEIAVRILTYREHAVMGYVGIVAGESGVVHEHVPVKPAQPVPCAQPDVAVAVLVYVGDGVVRKPVVGGIMLEYNARKCSRAAPVPLRMRYRRLP